MKQITLIILFLIAFIPLSGQIRSSADGFVFPLGCRAVLQMDSISKNGTYKYSVIYFDDLPEIVDTYDNDSIFFKNLPDNTIQIIFCIASSGKDRQEIEKNYRSALFVKSNYSKELKYKADIRTHDANDFVSTTVMPLFKQVKNVELWPYLINSIALYDFEELLKTETSRGFTVNTNQEE